MELKPIYNQSFHNKQTQSKYYFMQEEIQIKPVTERDDFDLLELVCQLHSRALRYPSKEMHDAYIEARTELKKRLKKYADESTRSAPEPTLQEAAKAYANYEIGEKFFGKGYSFEDIEANHKAWDDYYNAFIAGASFNSDAIDQDAFFKWVDENEIPRQDGKWIKYFNGKDNYLTTQELYNLFLKQPK